MQIEFKSHGRRAGATAGHRVRPMDRILHGAIGLIALCLCVAAAAVEMNSLYTVVVPLDPDDPDPRNLAYQTALTEVLVRVTGTTAVAESEQMAVLFPNPVRYVLQFRPGPDHTLVITLDGPAIENVLRQTGAPIWSSERPLTLIWIGVDWGQGEREIVAADDQERMPGDARSIDRNRLLRELISDIASRRGIPVLFPLLDTEDLENISFSDIWGGFDDILLQAAARYEAESVLVGRIRPDSLQENRWTWHHAGAREGLYGEPEDMIHRLADSLAALYVLSGRDPVDTIRLTISGINSVSAFGRVQRFMENLRGVDEIMIDTVVGDRIVYAVRIQGGLDRLQRALELSNLLELVDPMDEGLDAVSYDNAVRQRNMLEFLYRSD